MTFPHEVLFLGGCHQGKSEGLGYVRFSVHGRNFMWELHCNPLISRKYEVYDNLKLSLMQSLNGSCQSPYIIIIKVRASFFNRFYALKLCSTACFEYQRLTRTGAKTLQKSVSHVWWEWRKALPLHPQSREMRQ